MASIWQKDSWIRLGGLTLGLIVCAHALRPSALLPWGEIAALSLLAVLLRQRPVPLLKDQAGNVLLAHVPGESILVFLILRHGADAAICASLITNLLASILKWRYFLGTSSRAFSSLSNILWLPFITWIWDYCYQSLGGIRLQTPQDCGRIFQEPLCVAIPFLISSIVMAELCNRGFQGICFHLRYGASWRDSLGDLRLSIFEHLENMGALLALALWTTWGWGTLPFILLLMEAFLLSARERVQRIEARKQALSDPLTGLTSARGLSEAIGLRLQANTPFALLYMDMDHFKQINDTYGHNVGDELLVLVAKTLQAKIRYQDLVARRGGDEFIVLLTGMERTAAEHTREHLQRAVMAAIRSDPRFAQVNFSAGIGIFPQDGRTEENLLDAADQAMYAEKRTRRRTAA